MAQPIPQIRFPARGRSPLATLLLRMAIALGLLLVGTMVAYHGRDGYRDSNGTPVGFLDALYYSTVSITTTGYGDVIPVTDGARLATTLLVTPVRIVFLIILVGTTVEVLASRTRDAVREQAWRKGLRDHTIIIGYGTKGRAAIETMVARGTERDKIVVIDSDPDAVEDAARAGLTAIHGSAERTSVLEAAGVTGAKSVIVAPNRDDAAVLMTLTVRELDPDALIIAAARESENVHLLKQSGADSVILTSGAAGRLLGQAVHSPQTVEVLEDLLNVGSGIDLVERTIEPEEEGRTVQDVSPGEPVLAIVRDGELMRFDDERVATVRKGDRVICLCGNKDVEIKG